MSGEGLTLLAQGREAEIFLRPDGNVLKLMRQPEWANRTEREAAALEALHGDGLAAPEAHGTVTVDGRPGLVMERVDGVDLLTMLGRRPFALEQVARTMATNHAALHECRGPAALPTLRDELRRQIETAGALPTEQAGRALDLLATLPDGDCLCHGDFHPGNILGSLERAVVIDWGNATRGDPTADVARTHLLMAIGRPPPGTSTFLRVAAPVGGRIIAGRYLVAYRRLRTVDPIALSRWEVVRAAARFEEGVEDEFAGLEKFIAKAIRRLP